MATIFDTLESALQGNGLTGALGSVSGVFSGVSSVISGSGKNPPSSISGFGPALRSLPLPNLDATSGIGSTFTSLKGAMPPDPSSVTGGLSSGLDKLKSSGTDLTGQFGEALKVVQAIYQLTQLDFTGANPPPAPAPGGGAGGGAGAGAGGAANPPPPPPATATALDQTRSALDGLPSPFTVDSFLAWLQSKLADVTLDDFGIRQIPMITELRDYLGTLLSWKNADPNAIRMQIGGTLANLDTYLKSPLDSVFTPLTASSTALAPKLHATDLAQIADGIVARLGELKVPVTSGSLAGAGASITALTALLDQYDQLKAALTTDLAPLPAFQLSLRSLADDLDAEMGRVVSTLRPGHSLAVFDFIAGPIKNAESALQAPIDDLRHFLERLVSWLEDLLNKIDFKAVTQPLQDAATAMKSAVDSLDNAMVAVTSEVQQIFSKIESVLDAFDPSQITTAVTNAIGGFKTQIVQKITDLLKPVLDAVNQVVSTISQGIQSFDPNQLKTVIHDSLQKIAGVLGDPRIGDVRKDLDNLAQQLEGFSFAPFTGEVIKDLQGIADQIKNLGTLPSPLDQALHAALSVLPRDLKPVTDPIMTDFNQLVNSGPVKALDTVADLPKLLADKIKSFDPGSIVSSGLDKPYQQLLADMQGFKPSNLLAPLKTEFDSFKNRLMQNVSPSKALQALAGPFQDLSKALDSLHPDQLVGALDDKLKEVLKGITSAIPLDAVFSQVDAVIRKVKNVLDTAASSLSALDKARGILQGLADPGTQLDAWLAPIMAKLDGLGDVSALQTPLTSISASVDGLKLAAITTKVAAAVDPVASVLAALDPQNRWTAVVQAVRAIPGSAVDALPASTQKSQLKAALARLDPAQAATGAPFQTLATLSQSAAQAKSGLAAALPDWDTRYTASDAVLGGLHGLNAAPDQIKQWIHDAVTAEFIQPLAGFFALASPAFQMLDALAGELQKLMTGIQNKVAELMDGVAALTSIIDSLKQLLARITNFNLDFLRNSIKDLFDKLRSKLDALNPANLAKALDAAFGDVLNALTMDAFLPPATVATIDGDYAKLIDTLKALDPAVIVASVIQDVFDKDILPLVDKIDMSEPLHRISARFTSMAAELQTELGKVEDVFEQVLNSAAGGSGSGAAVSVGAAA